MKSFCGIGTVGLVVVLAFYWKIVAGHGVVGADIYPYFYPLKSHYAAELAQGRIAFWNPYIGFGIPQLAESQTGVFYPPNLVLYRLLELEAAYRASLVGHYVLLFIAAGLWLRRTGASVPASCVGASCLTLGWFVPRTCVEWAYVTGAWVPVVLWGVEDAHRGRPRRGWSVALAALVMQLLAGHFKLAFVTMLCATGLSFLRGCWTAGSQAPLRGALTSLRSGACASLVCLSALALAGVQTLPTWGLKARSQRGESRWQGQDRFYGDLPLDYLPQIWFPYHMYSGNPDLRVFPSTNKITAHVYFGQLVWLAALVGVAPLARDPRGRAWLVLAGVGLILAVGSGWPLVRAVYDLPGFSFFRAPADYALLTQLGVCVAAAAGVDRLWEIQVLRDLRVALCVFALPLVFGLLATLLAAVSGAEAGWQRQLLAYLSRSSLEPFEPALARIFVLRGLLWWFVPTVLAAVVLIPLRRRRTAAALLIIAVLVVETRWITSWPWGGRANYATLVPSGWLELREQSPVRVQLARVPWARVVAPGANVGALLSVSSVPAYLGFGPREYFEAEWDFGRVDFTAPSRRATVERLRFAGVTHVLTMQPLGPGWPADEVWRGVDPFLHRVWARSSGEPLHLYRWNFDAAPLAQSPDPIALASPGKPSFPRSEGSWQAMRIGNATDRAQFVQVRVLYDPGWRARMESTGAAVEVEPADDTPFLQFVLPPHATARLEYHPPWFVLGCVLSLVTACLLGLLCWLCSRGPVQ